MPGPPILPLRQFGAHGTVLVPVGVGAMLLLLAPALTLGAADVPGLLALAVATLLLVACRTRPVARLVVGGTPGAPALRRTALPLSARVADPVHHPRAARAPGTA